MKMIIFCIEIKSVSPLAVALDINFLKERKKERRKNRMIFSPTSRPSQVDIFFDIQSQEPFQDNFSDYWRSQHIDFIFNSFKQISSFKDFDQKDSFIDTSMQTESQKLPQTQKQCKILKGIIYKRSCFKATENSPFHNHQKHLNNALKKLITVPECLDHQEQYKKAAFQIWNKFLSLTIKTRKILHYIFNASNQYLIYKCQLEKYGLNKLYSSIETQTLNLAKAYLSQLAVRQLSEEKIDAYLGSSQLKKSAIFKQYILKFKEELSNKFLTKRLKATPRTP